MKQPIKEKLEDLYSCYNKREYVHPDPLEFLYDFPDIKDREIVGLIASSLAYGRVYKILKSVSYVLQKMGCSPYDFIMSSSRESLYKRFQGFKHRFTVDDELVDLLSGIKEVNLRFGSLSECLNKGFEESSNLIKALSFFRNELLSQDVLSRNSLLPVPDKGSACKRLNLYLRWMIRNDAVDPGGWDVVKPSSLIIPLDTHMHTLGIGLGLTHRKQADMRTAVEITEAFREISPEDPVKYDFSLTRLGIRDDTDMQAFLEQCKTFT